MGLAGTFALTGSDCDDKVGPGTGGAIVVGTLDESGCAPGDAPSARRYPLATFFHVETPFVPLGGVRPLDRGVYVLGGEDAATGGLSNELWLLDLTNTARTKALGECPWILVSTEFTPWNGVSRGALSYDPASELLTVVTGLVDDGTDVAAVTVAITAPAADPLSMLQTQVHLPTSVGTVDFVHEDASSFCGQPQITQCVDCPTHVVLEQHPWNSCDGSEVNYAVETGTCVDGFVPPPSVCLAAPDCAGQPTELPLPGTAQFAAFTDRTGLVKLFGGAAGCLGDCTTPDYAPLFEAGAPYLPDPNVGIVAGEVIAHRELAGSRARVDFGPVAGWGSPNIVNVTDTRPSNWPPGASAGLHHAAGVTLGRTWDPATRGWVLWGPGPGVEVDLLVGGNTFQRLSPLSTYVTEDDMVEFNCPGEPNPPKFSMAVIGEWLPWEEHAPHDNAFSTFTTPLVHELFAGSIGPVVVNPAPATADRVWGAAAVAIEPDAFLLAGGGSASHPSGGYLLQVVDFDDQVSQGTLFTLSDTLATPHFGAVAVFDPVENVAYVIGGSDDPTVETVAATGPVVANEGSVFLATEVEVSEDVDTNANANVLFWDMTSVTALRLQHRCRGEEELSFPDVIPGNEPDESSRPQDACFAEYLEVELRSPDTVVGAAGVTPTISSLSDFVGLAIDVRRNASEAWVELNDLEFVSFDDQAHQARLRVHLNRTLVDHQQLELRVQFQQRPWRQQAELRSLGGPDLGWSRVQLGNASSSDRRLAVHVGPPASVSRMTDAYVGATLPEADFGSAPAVRVRAPPNYRLVAGGADGCPGLTMLAPFGGVGNDQCRLGSDVGDRDQWAFGVAELVDAGITLPTAHGTFHVFVDSGAEARLRGVGGAFATHVGGAGFDADLDYATDRVGPYPREHTAVVYLREPSVDPVTGVGPCATTSTIEGDAVGLGGLLLISAVDCVAPHQVGTDFGDLAWKGRTFHESSHQRITIPYGAEPEARWLWAEGVVTTLHNRRYPTLGARRTSLRDGINAFVSREQQSPAIHWSVENGDHTTASKYETSAYLVEQLVLMSAAAPAHHPDLAVWSALADRLGWAVEDAAAEDAGWPGPLPGGARFVQPVLTAGLVRDWASDLGQATAWYDQLVAQDRPNEGLPLLGMVEYVAPSVVGGAQVNGSVKVRQVQGDLFGWPNYSDVPYHLGCKRRSSNSRAFTACSVDGVGRVSGTWPSRTSSTQTTVTLQKLAGIPQSENDAIVGLFSNDLALEGGVPAYGPAGRVKWLLRCRPGSTFAACLADTDADGAPNTGDCDPTNPAFFPAQEVRPGQPGAVSEWSLGGNDYNCDNWPTAAFVGN